VFFIGAVLRCVVLCTCVVAPLTGLACAVRVSSSFLLSPLIALSFRVRLDSAAAHVVRGARISLSALALYSPPESSSAAFIIMERVRAIAAAMVSTY